ncbi:HK97 family phage prohead protease [Mammaliicoccus sciuri]|uniref:HK97 family phage prohead protease n=1 Tax=Mammaliicoccus sciuri TaxID=1296 RepID=UPI00397A8AC6
MKGKEIRTLESVEVRSDDESNKMFIEGYALKYNTWSEDLGGFKETISPDALNETDLTDVRCLVDHIPSQIIGRTTAGTLKLTKDKIGLKYRCELPNTNYAKDLYENMRLGNINQCSFGFMLSEDGDEMRFDKNNNIYQRTLKNISQLTDVSVVTYPAYKDTDVAPALRSIEMIEKQNEDIAKKEELSQRLRKLQIENNMSKR